MAADPLAALKEEMSLLNLDEIEHTISKNQVILTNAVTQH